MHEMHWGKCIHFRDCYQGYPELDEWVNPEGECVAN